MRKPLGVRIAGTGSYLPEKILTNDWFTKHLDTTEQWILDRTGIRQRHVASEGESTGTLSVAAAKRALDDAGMTADDMDMIIVATITPEAPFPSTACFVQQSLCSKPVPAFDLAAACSGFIYAFLNASFILQGGAYKNILVIGAETLSRVTDYEDRTTCILFGDGAGAAVLTAADFADGTGVIHYCMEAEGTGNTMLFVPAGGSRLPASPMTVAERLHYIKMNGREVYKLAVKRNHELVDSTLGETGIKAEDIALVIPHQSNLRIIESARQRLGLPEGRMFTNIERCGNTSAASIPIGLDECRRNGRIKSGDLVLLIAFGAGLTWASALIRM